MTVSLVRGKLKLARSNLGHDLATLLILHGRFQSPVRSSFANGIILRMLTCFHLAKNVNPYSTQYGDAKGTAECRYDFLKNCPKGMLDPSGKKQYCAAGLLGLFQRELIGR